MAFDVLAVGTVANDGTGDTFRASGQKINDNFAKAVEGPASAVDNRIVVFDGTSGKLVDDGEIVTAQQLRSTLVTWSLTTGTWTLDFAGTMLLTTPTLTGAVTFDGTNYAEGRRVNVRVVAGGGSRNLTFATNWVFVGTKPTSIAANKTGYLELTAFGNTEASVLARWTVQT